MRLQLIAISVLVTALVACGGPQARKASYLANGRHYLAEHNYIKARLEFRNALQVDPNDAEASFLAGEAAERLGDVREAAQMFQAAIDSNDKHVGARAQLARIYAYSGAPDKAIELVEPGLAFAPEDPELLTSRGIARRLKGDLAGARSDAQEAVRLAPDNEAAVILLAGLYEDAGERQQAIDLLAKAAARPRASTDVHRALAQLYLDVGRHADATHELELNITADPSNAAHRLRLAEVLLRDKNVDGAEAVLRAAIDHAPNDPEATLFLANFLAQYRSFDAAVAELKRMTAAAPKDFALRLGFGQFYASHGKTAEAEAVFRNIIKDEGTNPSGLIARDRLATLYLAENRAAAAAPLIEEVLNKNPRDGDALFARARMEIGRGNFDAAVADLRAVHRDQPDSLPVERLLAQAYELGGDVTLAEETLRAAAQANPSNVEMTLELAGFLLRYGHADQAVPMLEKLAAGHPGDPALLDALFQAQIARKDIAGARRTAAAVLSARPEQASGDYMLGLAELADGKHDAARAAFLRAIAVQPDAAKPIEALVRLDVAEGHPDQALARLDQLIAKYPNNALLLNFRGSVLATLKRNNESMASYREAIRLNPSWPDPYNGLAGLQAASGNKDAAISTLQQGISATKDAAVLIAALATTYQRAGRLDDAIAQYEILFGREPESPAVANNLAMLLAMHRTDKASLDRARAVAERFARSSVPNYLDTWGWVLYKRGEFADAAQTLQKAVDRLPNVPEFRYHLAMAQLKTGATDAARANLTAALKPGAAFPGSDDAKSALQALSN